MLLDEVIEEQENCISIFEAEYAQDCPEQGILQTEITVKVQLFARVIPPFAAVEAFQCFSGYPFDDGRLYAASEEQKDRAVDQFSQGNGHDDGGDAVDDAERTGGKSPVCKSSVFNCSDSCFNDPSDERVDEEQPAEFRKSVFQGDLLFFSFPGFLM